MSKEKRKFSRAGIICKATAVFAERLLVFNSHTQNLSAGGIRVLLNEKLHVSTPVQLELFVCGGDSPVKCTGQVRWLREIEPLDREPRLIDTGLEFTQMEQSDREALGRLVNNAILQEQDYKN